MMILISNLKEPFSENSQRQKMVICNPKVLWWAKLLIFSLKVHSWVKLPIYNLKEHSWGKLPIYNLKAPSWVRLEEICPLKEHTWIELELMNNLNYRVLHPQWWSKCPTKMSWRTLQQAAVSFTKSMTTQVWLWQRIQIKSLKHNHHILTANKRECQKWPLMGDFRL